jgi:gas vesicle protein
LISSIYEEEEVMKEENMCGTSPGACILSFVIGGVVGAAVALLLAPKSGRETREQIAEVAHDVKERAEGYYRGVKEKVTEAAQKGCEVFKSEKEKEQTE